MRQKAHLYTTQLRWTGNRGEGTSSYICYDRSFEVRIDGKQTLSGSADLSFRGDAHLHNPEDMFVTAIASCHMLTYLALCASHGVNVLTYEDKSEGVMETTDDGAGRFTRVLLRPTVTLTAGSNSQLATSLHDAAHKQCFIANSCSMRIDCVPDIKTAASEGKSHERH